MNRLDEYQYVIIVKEKEESTVNQAVITFLVDFYLVGNYSCFLMCVFSLI